MHTQNPRFFPRYPVGRVQIFLVAQVSGQLGQIDVGVGGSPMGSTLNATWASAFVGYAAAAACSSPFTQCIRSRCGSYMPACPLSTSASSGKKPLVSSVTVDASVSVFAWFGLSFTILNRLQTFSNGGAWTGFQNIWMHVRILQHLSHC